MLDLTTNCMKSVREFGGVVSVKITDKLNGLKDLIERVLTAISAAYENLPIWKNRKVEVIQKNPLGNLQFSSVTDPKSSTQPTKHEAPVNISDFNHKGSSEELNAFFTENLQNHRSKATETLKFIASAYKKKKIDLAEAAARISVICRDPLFNAALAPFPSEIIMPIDVDIMRENLDKHQQSLDGFDCKNATLTAKYYMALAIENLFKDWDLFIVDYENMLSNDVAQKLDAVINEIEEKYNQSFPEGSDFLKVQVDQDKALEEAKVNLDTTLEEIRKLEAGNESPRDRESIINLAENVLNYCDVNLDENQKVEVNEKCNELRIALYAINPTSSREFSPSSFSLSATSSDESFSASQSLTELKKNDSPRALREPFDLKNSAERMITRSRVELSSTGSPATATTSPVMRNVTPARRVAGTVPNLRGPSGELRPLGPRDYTASSTTPTASTSPPVKRQLFASEEYI